MLIAASLSEKAHLYLWDEPLNYIDVFSRMQLEELLVRQPMTMVFIEHDDAFVQRVAQTVITW
ncbi:MAG: ABC transporter ATP-binding protein [Merdibacter sp.]